LQASIAAAADAKEANFRRSRQADAQTAADADAAALQTAAAARAAAARAAQAKGAAEATAAAELALLSSLTPRRTTGGASKPLFVDKVADDRVAASFGLGERARAQLFRRERAAANHRGRVGRLRRRAAVAAAAPAALPRGVTVLAPQRAQKLTIALRRLGGKRATADAVADFGYLTDEKVDLLQRLALEPDERAASLALMSF
jgi:hypothetical protein